MLVMPAYHALLFVPMLELLWAEGLPLSILHLGPWEAHTKCPSCMERYERLYSVAENSLADVPYDMSLGSRGVLWGPDFSAEDLRDHLRVALGTGGASRAEVLVCVAAMWLCALMQAADARPLLVFEVTGGGAPLPLRKNPDDLWKFQKEKVMPDLMRWYGAGRTQGELLQSLWVRPEPIWAYGRGLELPSLRAPRYARGFFYPFVAMPSLHIKDKYTGCTPGFGDILVMREGSWPGRFAYSLRGQIFFGALKQFIPPSSPIKLKLMPYSDDFLTHRALAKHRAAVWAPLVHCCKLTFNDLVRIEIPLFLPSEALHGSIAARWQCKNQLNLAGRISRRVAMLDQCQIEEVDRWLPLSSFMRYPHVRHFGSLADLASQLSSATCAALNIQSSQMARWNRAVVEDDAAFWRSALGALRAGPSRAGGRRPAAARPEMRLPLAPRGSLCDTRGDFELKVSLPEAQHCNVGDMSREWRERCCHTAAQLKEWTPERASARGIAIAPEAGAPGAAGELSRQCLWSPKACDPKLLRFGTHLLQELPPLS